VSDSQRVSTLVSLSLTYYQFGNDPAAMKTWLQSCREKYTRLP